MNTPEFTVACVATDRTRPLASGEIVVEGARLSFSFGEPEEIFRRALRERAFELTELSMASHIVTTARGDSSYVGVPVFLSRSFRHSALFVRSDSDIRTLKDLRGKNVGVPEYQQTAAMWVRGMMLDEGVAASDVRWHVGSLNEPGAGERIKLSLPESIEVHALSGADTLNDQLIDGRLDAIISPRVPAGLQDGSGRVCRLFGDLKASEIEFYRRTGFFPIMHCLAVRKDVAEAHSWLPAALFRAFSQAKRLRLEEMALTNVLRVSLPSPMSSRRR